MKIAVIMPSRGLLFARTIEWLEEQRKKYNITLYISHNLPIPECFNKLTEKALRDKPNYLFYLEDDIVPPRNAIKRLLNSIRSFPVACIDYPFRAQLNNVSRDHKGEIMSCGLGCTMVRANIYSHLKKPYFRSDRRYDWQTRKWYKCNAHKVYGLQDMWFTYIVRKAGFKIKQVPGECIHLGLIKLGRPNINDGCHQIGERPKIAQKLIRIDAY